MDSKDLIVLLEKQWDYSPQRAEEVTNKILNLAQDILLSFEHWLDTGEFLDTPAYSGCTPKVIQETYPNFKPPAVFLLLDWIRREPDEALAALRHEFKKPCGVLEG